MWMKEKLGSENKNGQVDVNLAKSFFRGFKYEINVVLRQMLA